MDVALTSLSSVLIALVLGGFAWLRSDIVRLTGRVEKLTDRVDDLSDRTAKIEGILESRR
ncbi:MAG: hypothetical protein F4153_10020 [Acidimicrobiia bacterium]|nr:hypothetical protein [Acidimicrobiia bacterium]